LWRIGAGAPTDEQMAEIYEEEKALFNENARCTLQGSSSDVLALDQHKTDNILAVYSTDHITKFNGLLVVSDEAIDNTPHDIETYNFLDDTDKAIFDIQREANRAAISEVPGSGSILGVCVFDNTVYAFRNNAGGTAAVMYKATVSGWTVVATPTLAIDGQYEFDTYNFGSSIMLYGCDGKNKAFQFNGTTLTQLSTGQSTDTPNHIKGHKNHLFLSFPGGHLVHSAITDPTDYTAINGAAEYNVKGEITSLAHLIGDLLVVFCKNQIIPIYGTSAADFEMKIHSESAGAFARSVATDATPIFFGEQGITVLSGTQEYGNFQTATLTQKIKPFLKDFADDSYVAGAVLDFDNSLYRLYFTDGKVLNLQFNGRAGGDSLLADYELDINCIANGRLDEEEVIFAGGTDGYVYQMETGYSNDGEEIESFIKTSFAHFGMPQQKKRFFKVLMEIDSPSPVVFSFATDYDYGTDYYPTSREKSDTVNSGGGTWDVHNWDEFLWSSQIVDELEVHLDGTGKNISMVISTLTKNTRPYVIQSITYHFAVRGIIK
ncbi:MAG: hypothetical protein GY829_11065, partial [Gammaproteobacteria bacterium]|nr:hypothetical protein [Gammaproteobacteria bacterium]